jgi:hypothetical protein
MKNARKYVKNQRRLQTKVEASLARTRERSFVMSYKVGALSRDVSRFKPDVSRLECVAL